MDIYILSIDGGGIRGVIPARILQRIENDLSINKDSRETFIYDTFNIFAGSSSGSILVGGLCYHKSSMTYIIDNYINFENFSNIMPNTYRHVGIIALSTIITVFCVCLSTVINPSVPGLIIGILSSIIIVFITCILVLYTAPVYPKNGKTKIIEDYVGKDTRYVSENGKDVFITAYNMSKQRPEFFKSWENNNYLTKDVIDASTAVPGLYSAVKIDGDYYIDGGVTTNNPTDYVYSEIIKKYKNSKVKILSIGCGRKTKFKIDNMTDWGHLKWVTSGNVGLFIGDEQMVNERLKNFTDVLDDVYLRIDGEIDDLFFTDTSDKYKTKLNDIADMWYSENRDKLIEFFK